MGLTNVAGDVEVLPDWSVLWRRKKLNFKNRNTSFPTKASAPWQGTERGMEAVFVAATSLAEWARLRASLRANITHDLQLAQPANSDDIGVVSPVLRSLPSIQCLAFRTRQVTTSPQIGQSQTHPHQSHGNNRYHITHSSLSASSAIWGVKTDGSWAECCQQDQASNAQERL